PRSRLHSRSRGAAWPHIATAATACTSTSRCALRPRGQRSTDSGSRPLDGSGRPRERQPDLTLADADAYALHRKPFGDRIGTGRGESLEQVELPSGRDLLHDFRHGDVVDGVLEPVGEWRIRDLEPQVVEEVGAAG